MFSSVGGTRSSNRSSLRVHLLPPVTHFFVEINAHSPSIETYSVLDVSVTGTPLRGAFACLPFVREVLARRVAPTPHVLH
jgi:hypothetical protein